MMAKSAQKLPKKEAKLLSLFEAILPFSVIKKPVILIREF